MRRQRVLACFVAAAWVLLSPTRVQGQAPIETNVYILVDVGPVFVPLSACACVGSPFALPTYVPPVLTGSGPAAPLQERPLSRSVRHRYAKRLAEDRRNLARDKQDGLGGNGHAALAVAFHFITRAFLAGGDARLDAEAARWLHVAAFHGHRDAFKLLGYRYLRGRGVPQSDETAAYFFQRGAVRDDQVSKVALGLLYAAGRGVVQDWVTAVGWWRQADFPLAWRFLGDAYTCGLGVERNQEQALLAYEKAAADVSAMIQLGDMYANGCAGPDDRRAVAAYRRAADQGYPEAQIALSDLLRDGRGAEPNPNEAYFWARLSERRLRAGQLRDAASARMSAAARLMTPEAIAASEFIVEAMLIEATRPLP